MHSFPLARLHVRSDAGNHARGRTVHVRLSVLLFAVTMQTQRALLVVCEMVIVSGKLSQDTICSSGLKAAGGSRSRRQADDSVCAKVKPEVKVCACSAPLLPPRLLKIWNGPNSHRPRSGLHGAGPPGRDLSDDWRSGAVCCGVSHLPRADWLQLQDLHGYLFFLTPSSEDRWIFSPCFLIGDGLFPDSVASQIYLNVPLQLNTCSVEEVKKKTG